MKTNFIFPYLHGFIFSLSACLSVYITMRDATTFAPPSDIARPTAGTLLAYLVIALLAYLISRDHDTSGLTATSMILGTVYLWNTFVVTVIASIITWGMLVFISKKMNFAQLHAALTTIGISFLVYFGATYSIFIIENPWGKHQNLLPKLEFQTSEPANKPDIYYIILDGYGEAEMLQSLHHFDNTPFITELEKRGFIVPEGSKSNYARTLLSLGSSLNMQYLESATPQLEDSYLWWPLAGTIHNSQTMTKLEGMEYNTVNIASGWGITSLDQVDNYKKSHPILLNDFEEIYFQFTNLSLLGSLNQFGITTASYDTHREIILSQVNILQEIPPLPSPKFVFVHIVSPHPPFVLDADGSPKEPDYPYTLTDDRYFFKNISTYREGYLPQLTFVNHMILQAIDNILQRSKTPPIIILQGDHGPGALVDYRSSEKSCLYERFSILNAYYLPSISEELPHDITPVNTFRFIFNEYFQADLELLPNRYYFSTPEKMYQFEDVSNRVNETCPVD